MEAQWRIRVRGKQRESVDVALLVAAVMALAEQWAKQERCSANAPTVLAEINRPVEEAS